MSGSVRKAASGIRIAVHLIDASGNVQLWSETLDRRLETGDIYAVQDDVTDRIVATVADKAGVLARSMAQSTQGIPIDRLNANQLVHRMWAFEARPTPSDHAALRTAIEAMLDRQPHHAELWAELANVYVAEHCLFYNPLPDSLGRGLRAARRAVEIDRTNQRGWVVLANVFFFERDDVGFQEAADKLLALNPRNSNAIAWMGAFTTHKGDYDRGRALMARAIALNPVHPGWYHFVLFNRYFARREFEEALRAARRVNIPGFMWMHLAIAGAAGQLGLAAEGKAAVTTMEALAPPLAHEEHLRELLNRWYWDESVVEGMVEGVRRSKLGIPGQTTAPAASLASPAASGAAHMPRPSDPASVSPATVAGTWIAVVPFSTTGSDEESRALADGLTEDVTAGLSRFAYLSVVAAHTARQRAGSGGDARQLGAGMGARYLLDGSIRRAGSALRIGVRLLDSDSGAQLWSDAYARDLQGSDVLTLQDDLTDRIVATVADVHGVLMRSMSQEIGALGLAEDDPRALRFRYWAYHRQHAPREHALLRDLFERVADKQPGVAAFWTALAHLYWHEHGFGFNVRPGALARARQAATRALDLDPLSQHAWEALATVYFLEHDREGFTHAIDRVLALNQRNAHALALAGTLLVHADELDRGLALTDRAIALNPDHPGWYHMARATRDYVTGDDEGALRAAKRINMPDHVWAHFLVALSAGQLGRAADATAALDAVYRVAPAFAEESTVAEQARQWKWNEAHVERILDGYRKAVALSAPTGRLGTSALPVSTRSLSASSSASDRSVALGLRVAVLPFTADAAAASLAEGLTDAITTGLSRFSYLRVFAGATSGDARSTGRSLGAGYVLDGAVRTAGHTLRVSARLIDVDSGAHLWAEQYDRTGTASDLFAVQADLASRVVATLADGGGVLERALTAALKRAPVEQRSDAQLWLRFGEYVEHFTAEKHFGLRSGFEALVARDPSSASAWAYLSVLYGHEVFFGFNPLPEPLPRVRTAAERALSLDVASQPGWYALAEAALFERNLAEFTTAAERAIELNPLHSRTAGAIGLFYAFTGDTARGAALVDRAIALNPRYPGWFHIALFLHAFHTSDANGALAHAARINMPHLPIDGRLFAIAAAGRFGRAAEAAAGLEAVARTDASLLDPRRAREGWAVRIWEGELLDGLVDGFQQALALTGRLPPEPSTVTRPASSDALSDAMPQPAPPLSRHGVSDAGALAIAVRLFTARGGDSATELAEGLSEDVTTGLSRFPYLRVVPRATVEGTAAAPARYALEGQVRRAASTVRVSARLIDTMVGAQLWAENYDRPAGSDVFQMQDDIASRIVATVADANGVMLRSMSATLRQRPIAAHSVSDLVIRFYGYLEHFDPAEHAQLRDGLMAALKHDPNLADGWACLSSLIEHEHSHGLNPQANSPKRAREHAERSIAANPVCQEGWRAMASTAFSARDAAGVRIAAERAIAINPLNTSTVAICGMFLAYSGTWDRGLEVMRQAMQPNPHYPGWLHFPFFTYHYNREEYAEALRHAKPINMPRFPKWHLTMAAVAGRLGLRDEACLALEALRRLDPAAGGDEYVRAAFASWVWTDEEMEHVVEGVRKARALAGSGTAAP